MKSIASASIAIFAALVPLVKAWPVQSRGYVQPNTTSIEYIKFGCGDNNPEWIVDVGFGTPNQPASLLIDTTFDSTFVAGVKCRSEFCVNQKGPLYNAGKSSSAVNLHINATFDLGDGEIVRGDIYKDSFNFGPFTMEDATFGKAFEVQGFPIQSNYAGVYGLSQAFTSTTSKSRRANPSSFTQAMGPYPIDGGPQKRDTGINQCILTFGIDTSLVSGEISWLSLPTCDYGLSPFWKTDLTCVEIDGVVDLKFKNTVAEFDTAVKNIEVPEEDLKKIYKGLDAAHDNTFKCCNAKDLKISFAEYTVSIPPSSWTNELDSTGEICSAKISASSTIISPVNRWRLGTSFMNNFYIIFDVEKEQTGIALSKFGNEQLRISKK